MLITYRRTGGLFALLTLAGVAVAATVLTVAVTAIVLAVAVAIASVVVLRRAVAAISSSETHNIPRIGNSTR